MRISRDAWTTNKIMDVVKPELLQLNIEYDFIPTSITYKLALAVKNVKASLQIDVYFLIEVLSKLTM